MDLALRDRVAIVTGASRGLGAAIATALAAEGMRAIITGRDTAALENLASLHPGSLEPVVCDAEDLDSVAQLVDIAVDRFGRLDVIVNNAGIAPAARFEETTVAQWSNLFSVNLLAPVALTLAAFEQFRRQGSGKVINVASISGLRGKPTLSAYSASKGAVLRFTEALAGEWARLNIQVNAIAPGAFATDAQRAVLDDPEILARRLRKIPVRRMAVPEEIGPLACYLASPLSDFVTGATYVIDGGEASTL